MSAATAAASGISPSGGLSSWTPQSATSAPIAGSKRPPLWQESQSLWPARVSFSTRSSCAEGSDRFSAPSSTRVRQLPQSPSRQP